MWASDSHLTSSMGDAYLEVQDPEEKFAVWLPLFHLSGLQSPHKDNDRYKTTDMVPGTKVLTTPKTATFIIRHPG